MKTHHALVVLLAVVIIGILLVIPTGTPEDLVITIPLYGAIGHDNFVILTTVLIALLLIAIYITYKMHLKGQVTKAVGF